MPFFGSLRTQIEKLRAQFVTIAKEIGKEGVSDSLDDVSAREVVKNWLAVPVGY